MEGIKLIGFLITLWGFQLYTVHCQTCKIEKNATGRIVVSERTYWIKKCWMIPVPSGHFVHLQFSSMRSNFQCSEDFVDITIAGTSDVYKYCSSDNYKSPVTAFGTVTVTHSVLSNIERYTGFTLEYTITTICRVKNSFKCDNNLCVLEEKVCDGVKDCRNGEDETGCPGILDIVGIDEARESAIYWLRSRKHHLKSHELPRAVVALFLGSSANFNGTDLEEELMATQVELKTATALLKSSVSSTELSMFINALLVTCHDPRKFYEHNLVNRLKEQVQNTQDFVHPLAYLTLCNANETWPEKAESQLNRILESNLEYPRSFLRDLQAVAIMAFSCKSILGERFDSTSSYNLTAYYDVIKKFKESQLQDGSFGNIYTTALITQALIASGEALKSGWDLDATFEFLMRENNINSSSIDFLTTYYTLPLLNGKTLVDISTIDCSANPRKQGYDIENDFRSKMHILYSIYIGDEKDALHTISIRAAENSTAFEIMKSAAIDDPNYHFEAKAVEGNMYVYRIGGIPNDPDMGKYWFLYVRADNNTQELTHLTTSPDQLFLRNRQHLVYWRKTVSL